MHGAFPRIFSCLNIWIPRSLQYREGERVRKIFRRLFTEVLDGRGWGRNEGFHILPFSPLSLSLSSSLFLPTPFFLISSFAEYFDRIYRNNQVFSIYYNDKCKSVQREREHVLRKAMKKLSGGLLSSSFRRCIADYF